ncbi:tyrosine--tRNA ligase [Candidatus Liberibacter africanus]|uniref:Tyrosine--tRNA ligase n=1 Tax=Candidatus Liberibacter africanus PTSAPSY TaxID=1277257 RepID=A0A0G3I5W8_LIBAF|nr:tyrosine--tRNA ligase [Candidatus Liberibacter africanus]AKK20665.1 tyrosyl-tRNA synthetase [Candidatus Liberibacter africanus PTSAPSY]QTP64337.1 tyrosine--tRNA ligase [Candidatus Liberibacter africanus]
MSSFKSDFLNILSERGFIYQISHPQELDSLCSQGIITAYIGYDPTASSLHAGHLTQLMLLFWLQKTGHRPISLMGGGTSVIGDPSFRTESRKMMSSKEINQNIEKIQGIFSSFIKYGDGKTDALMLNNADWLCSIQYIDFLREIGSYFSINRMLSFESVRSRLKREQSLSFLEFNYMILQAYDFVELAKNYDCRLQMGGSDQWGNIICGIDLGERLKIPQLFALTSPLLTTSSGSKMGKTMTGTIWLNKDMTSPYDFWQYWRDIDDADVVNFAKRLTTLPMSEIDRLAKLQGKEINEAKKIIATEITTMVHGREEAEKAATAARECFDMSIHSQHMPTISISKEEIKAGINIVNLIIRAGFATSMSEANRHIKGNAIKINNKTIANNKLQIELQDFNSSKVLKMSFGKKRQIIYQICD